MEGVENQMPVDSTLIVLYPFWFEKIMPIGALKTGINVQYPIKILRK